MRVTFRLAASQVCGLVLVLCCSAVFAVTSTWSGGANDSNWKSNANWEGLLNGAEENEDLVFPNTAARKTNFNNFDPDTPFRSLIFTGANYSISGNRIVLGTGGITGSIPSGTHAFNPSIRVGSNFAIENSGPIPLTLGGEIQMNGRDIGITGSGDVVLGGAITGGSASTSINKTGTGKATFNGTSPNSGPIVLNSGTMQIEGQVGNITLLTGSAATLAGSGTVGDISPSNALNKTISPGSSTNDAGILTAGNVVLSAGLTLQVDLKGTVGGTQYDRLATSSINLGGANLSVSLAFDPAPGAVFTIVTTAPAGRTGNFAQGSSIVVGGRTFTITYNAANVVLTAGPRVRTWNGASAGAGANSNWSNGANWVGGVPPVGGEQLVFPATAARKTNSNDIAAGTAFVSVTLAGAGFTISGNQIVLSGGLLADYVTSGPDPRFVVPIKLAASQSFNNISPDVMRLGALDLNGFDLTVTATENINITGQLIGTGNIAKEGTAITFLSGTGNTYSGVTLVNAGVLTLFSHGAAGASTAGNGTEVANGATLRVSADTAHAEPVRLNGTGAAGLSGALATQFCGGGCSLTGPITLASATKIAAVSATDKLTLGPIQHIGAAQPLTIAGQGTVVMAGANTHTGATVVTEGTLLVNGTSGPISLSGGKLGGTGTVGSVSGNGTVAPGASAGALSVAGSVTFTAGNVFAIEIGSTTAGTGYDQMNATGAVALGGATLNGTLINGFVPAPGDSFTILQSNAGITGQFAQGSSITFSGVTFNITYNATSIVLSTAATPALPDLTVTKTHTGNFAPGQIGAAYTVTVTNAGAGTKAAGQVVTVVDTPPAGLTVTGMSGTGWVCTTLPTCTRSDVLAGFQSYPPLTVSVTVAGNATSPQINNVAVTTAATESSTANNSAADSTTIGTPLTVTKSGSGTGTVVSQDGGINCGATCTNAYVNGSNITLSAAPDAGSMFTGWLGPCTGTGPCVVPIGASAMTVPATFALTGTQVLDIDGNSGFDALTDGVMVIRYLFGVTGTALTTNAIGTGATRTGPAAVLAHLNDIRPLLDVDGNGVVDAFTDGLLILRHLFGLTGTGLIQNAIGAGATRDTDTAILNHLSTLKQ
jgi:fibronectin-binding autotransporter adhesin